MWDRGWRCWRQSCACRLQVPRPLSCDSASAVLFRGTRRSADYMHPPHASAATDSTWAAHAVCVMRSCPCRHTFAWHNAVQAVINDQPWTPSRRRQMVGGYLAAKLDAGDDVLGEEGCAGFWELAINKDNHGDIRMDRCAVGCEASPASCVAHGACACMMCVLCGGLVHRAMPMPCSIQCPAPCSIVHPVLGPPWNHQGVTSTGACW